MCSNPTQQQYWYLPFPGNPFEIDCAYFGAYWCATARSWLPGGAGNGNEGWFTRNPRVPVTPRTPLILPGFYVNGVLIEPALGR